MKYFYVGLCLLAMVATIRLSSQFTRALASHKGNAKAIEFSTPEGQTSPQKQRDAVNATRTKAFVPLHESHLSDTESETTGMPDSPNPASLSDIATSPSAPVSNRQDSLARTTYNTLPTVRHRGSLHDTMITPGNFEYMGAIRPPHIQQNETTFAYGGWGIAYRAEGDADGENDGYPGSLFLVGHQNQQMVAEISIPAPINLKYKRADDLPVAEILQPFHDVTGGLLAEMTAGSSEHFHLGGLLVTNGLLHWTMHKYYNVANIDYPSHGTSGLDMAVSVAEGLWHLGPMNTRLPEWHSYKHAGYVFDIPPQEAKQWFGGRNLISGLQISTGLQASSQGPAMFAYALPPEGAAPGTSLNAIPLAWYSQEQPVDRHHPSDRWAGGAWLTLGTKQAVVIAGRKALGEFYYGEARPQDCTPDKGYHGPPYEVELMFYSPASLIHAASGAVPAHGLKPWYRWDENTEGGGLNQYMFDTCGKQVGGLAYDRDRNLLYLVQIDAGKTRDNEFEMLPVIHVFRLVE